MIRYVVMSAVVLVSASLFAEEKKEEKKEETLKTVFSMSGMAYGASYASVSKDDAGAYSAVRLNPSAVISKGGITGTIELEYDALFGAVSSAAEGSGEAVTFGGDKMNIEMAKAFFTNTFDAVPGLSFTAGIAPYSFPLVFGDNAPLFGLRFAGNRMEANAYYMKIFEGENNSSSDDAQVYAADFTFTFGDSSIRPALFITQSKINADSSFDSSAVKYRNKAGIITAIASTVAAGSFSLDLAGAFSRGRGRDGFDESVSGAGETVRIRNGKNISYSSWAFDAAPSFKVKDLFSFGLFLTGVSGDDGDDEGKDSSFLNAALDGRGAGINSFRLFIVEDAGSFTTNSDVANAGKYSNTFGYYAAGCSAGVESGGFTIDISGAYIRSAKASAGSSKVMGIECDLSIGYEVTSGVTLYGEGAFLKTGSFYKDAGFAAETQNAAYINAGMKYEL